MCRWSQSQEIVCRFIKIDWTELIRATDSRNSRNWSGGAGEDNSILPEYREPINRICQETNWGELEIAGKQPLPFQPLWQGDFNGNVWRISKIKRIWSLKANTKIYKWMERSWKEISQGTADDESMESERLGNWKEKLPSTLRSL